MIENIVETWYRYCMNDVALIWDTVLNFFKSIDRIYLKLSWCSLLIMANFSTKFGQNPNPKWKRPFHKPHGRENFVHGFSTWFSPINREPFKLQAFKLSQKNPLVILLRMVYSMTGINGYLKSEIGEIGHFWCILGFFRNFSPFSCQKRGRGQNCQKKLHISATRGRCSTNLFSNDLFLLCLYIG